MVAGFAVIDDYVADVAAKMPDDAAASGFLLLVDFPKCGEVLSVVHASDGGDGGDGSEGDGCEECHGV